MSLLEFSTGPLAHLWALALVHFLWQGTAIALGVWCVLQLCRVASAPARYTICLSGMMLMGACLPVTLAVLWNAPVASPEVAAVPDTIDPPSTESVPLPFAAKSVVTAAESQESETVAVASGFSLETMRWWILVLWTCGVFLMAARLIASWLGTAVIIKRRSVIESSQIQELLARLAARLNIARLPQVCASYLVNDATAVGFWRPLILLPAAWVTELPPDMLEAVLAHELAHVRRGDLWWNLFQRIVETVLFYHPAVWWLSRRVRAERECCCDELAVSATHQRLVYATTLEYVARERTGGVRPLVAVTLGDSHMALLKRIRHILGMAPATGGSGWGAIALLAVVLPVSFWLLSSANTRSAQADDEKAATEQREKAELAAQERREGERREVEQRRDGERRETEQRRDGERREDVRREVERREGDRRPGGDQGGPRPEGRSGERREGAESRPGERGPIGPGPFRPGERGPQPNREGGPPPVMQEMQEMIRIMQDLRREVEQLRREVNELKSQRPPGPGLRGGPGLPGRPDMPRGEGRPNVPGAGPRDGDRPQGPPPGARDGERPQGGPRDGDRPQGGPRGPRDGDRPGTGPREGDRPQGPPRGPADAPRREGAPRDGERREGPRDADAEETDASTSEETAAVTIRGILPKLTPDTAVSIVNFLTKDFAED